MKKILKLIRTSTLTIVFFITLSIPSSAIFIFGMDAILPRPIIEPFAVPRIAAHHIPPIDIVPPMVGPQIHEAHNRPPIAKRKTFNTKKEAYEAAKRAGGGKEPRHDPNGHDKVTRNAHGKITNTKPHYHPAGSHDHYYYHRVIAGDNLTKIAQKYKSTIKTIVELNNIKDKNKINVGQILKIPK